MPSYFLSSICSFISILKVQLKGGECSILNPCNSCNLLYALPNFLDPRYRYSCGRIWWIQGWRKQFYSDKSSKGWCKQLYSLSMCVVGTWCDSWTILLLASIPLFIWKENIFKSLLLISSAVEKWYTFNYCGFDTLFPHAFLFSNGRFLSSWLWWL